MQPLEPNIPRLRKNLAALARVDTPLAQRLHLPVDDAHVRIAPAARGAGVHYKMGRGWMPLGIGREATQGLLGDPEAPCRVLCFGVGLGELVQAALKRWPKAEIVAWDRDPWLLRVALGRHDWRGPLRAGRLRLALAADLLDHLPWTDHVVHHPVLERVHSMERHLLEHGLGERRALVVTGELFVGDLADALRHRGYTVIPWEVERHAAEEIAHNARRSGASLVASINYTGGLAEGCNAAGLPLICWEIDPALNSAQARGATDKVWVFTHDPLNVSRYQAGGFEHVEYMPLAANPRVRAPTDGDIDPRYQAPVSFVGSSMLGPASRLRGRFNALLTSWAQAAGAGVPGDLVQRILLLQRQHHDRFIVSEALDAALPGFRAAVMAAGEGDPGMMLGETAAAEKRLNIVAGLGPVGVHAWGDDGWKLAERGGASYRGRAGHSHEINFIYQASTISLDIDRLYQREIVTMRVFDVLSCGGFVIAEHSPHLGEIFELDSELVCWHNPADLERKVRHFLAHPDEAAPPPRHAP